MIVLSLAGCGDADRPAAAPGSSNLINTPAIARLSEDQLRGLVVRCARYQPLGLARGPYSAKYCDDAQAAWSDSPLHLVVVPPAP